MALRGYYKTYHFAHFKIRLFCLTRDAEIISRSVSAEVDSVVIPLSSNQLASIGTSLYQRSCCPGCLCFRGQGRRVTFILDVDLVLTVEPEELCSFSKLIVLSSA